MAIWKIRYRRPAAVLVGLALATGVLASAPADASAAPSTWVGSWNVPSNSWCAENSYAWCLYYSPNAKGGRFGSHTFGISNLSGYTFSGSGLAGAGDPVRNDAASMEDPSDCDLQVFVYPNFVGNSNEVAPGRGGNLNSSLRNNEASVANYNGC